MGRRLGSQQVCKVTKQLDCTPLEMDILQYSPVYRPFATLVLQGPTCHPCKVFEAAASRHCPGQTSLEGFETAVCHLWFYTGPRARACKAFEACCWVFEACSNISLGFRYCPLPPSISLCTPFPQIQHQGAHSFWQHSAKPGASLLGTHHQTKA